MIGAFEIGYSLLNVTDPIEWPLQKRACSSHVYVDSAEQKTSWVIAYQLRRLLQILQAVFVLPFVNIRQTEPEVSLGQTSPIARLTIAFQGALRIVSGNIVFRDPPIDARECRVN